MDILTENKDKLVTLKITGRLDTNTAPDLEKKLTEILDAGYVNLTIDFDELDYISSSGLRVLLIAAKDLDEVSKKITFINVKDYIKEVFDIAGFTILFDFK